VNRITTAELDNSICNYLRSRDLHPTNADSLVELAGTWRRIDSRMQAMRKAGRIKFHKGPSKLWPSHVRRHGWEVVLNPTP
jgi:hypothetical protein